MMKWQKVKLGDVVQLIGGGTPKTSVSEYWNGNIPWLSVKDFNNELRYVYSTEKTITELGLNNSSTKLLEKNDIIISARGTVGELAMIPFPMAFNQSCYGIRAKNIIDSDFLYYLLKANIFILKKNTHGSVFDTITTETLLNLSICLPPLPTQKKIAEVLSCLDAKIELNRRINENLEQQAQAIFKEWFVNNAKPEWKVGKLEEFAKVKGGKRLPKGKNLTSEKTSHPYIRIRDLNNTSIVYLSENFEYVDDDTQKVISRYIVHSKDVLLSIVGTIGLTVLVDDSLDSANLTENCVKITELKDLFPEYIFLYLKSDVGQNEIKKRTVGAVQQKLPIKNIEDIPILVPDRETINIIAPIISALFSDISKNLLQSQILVQIRDTLLLKLMSGEIEV